MDDKAGKQDMNEEEDTTGKETPIKERIEQKAEHEIGELKEKAEQAKEHLSTLRQAVETIEDHIEAAEATLIKPDKKVPLLLRIYGVLCLIAGLAGAVLYGLTIAGCIEVLVTQTDIGIVTVVLVIIYAVLSLVGAIMFVVMGARLVRNKAKAVAKIALSLTVVLILTLLVEMMINGFDVSILPHLVQLAVVIALMTYLDPTLMQERALQSKLRKMDKEVAREEKERAWARGEKDGFIPLNFFNIFWIFVVCCLIGDLIEVVYHFALFGDFQRRTGMLFGPFSPIYGFGALLMTVALNRFYKKPTLLLFLISALIGGAFEFCVSLFMELAFGVTAWDYTGTWLSIGGRTNGMYMIMWGLLGVAWIKLMLPLLLRLINKIPWDWRYGITTVCCTLMLLNGFMTLSALGCWTERMSGQEPVTATDKFYAEHFPNDWMANHFQSMEIHPEKSTNIQA